MAKMAQITGKMAHFAHAAAFLNAKPLTHSQFKYAMPLLYNADIIPLTTFPGNI